MTENEALKLLQHHSYTHPDLYHPTTEKGFLGMLRPFDGQLYESNFHEMIAILKTLKEYFRNGKIDRQIISSLWSICHLSTAWGLDKAGMLRRNKLLNANQIEQLAAWIDCISYAVMGLLQGIEDELAFEPYQLYLNDKKENPAQ